MTTTSILHHKPPPLKTRNDNPSVCFLRSNNYYGSVGRPHHGRRKSAVELLQESKAFYVKSESVLDTKQEFHNPDHLQVKSPTVEMNHYSIPSGMGPHPPSAPPTFLGAPAFSYANFTCPPYPHEHFQHNLTSSNNYINSLNLTSTKKKDKLKSSKKHDINTTAGLTFETTATPGTKVTAKITLIETHVGNAGENIYHWHQQNPLPLPPQHQIKSKSSRRAIQPPASLQLKEQIKDASAKSAAAISAASQQTNPALSLPLTFTSFSQNGSLYSSLEKQHCNSTSSANTNGSSNATSTVSNSNSTSLLSNHGKNRERIKSENESPPPLPPKSPRTTSKPTRPHDFPQRLVQNQQSENASNIAAIQPPFAAPTGILPPPPPRRNQIQSHPQTKAHGNPHPQLRRSDPHSHQNPPAIPPHANQILPMTLPSPILPPTPPPDVVMESPMSDSGPIISPPPAFSTPVTPMLDRQNSAVSDDRSSVFYTPGMKMNAPFTGPGPIGPLIGSSTTTMSGVSSGTSSRTQSQPDDISMRCYSPRSRSRSRSSCSPMSHQDQDLGGSGRGSSGGGCGATTGTSSSSSEEGEAEINSHSEEEAEISADVDGDDDDSSRALEPSQLSTNTSTLQLQLQPLSTLTRRHSQNYSIVRNNSKKSVSSTMSGGRDGGAGREREGIRKIIQPLVTSLGAKVSQSVTNLLPKSVTENFLSSRVAVGLVETSLNNNLSHNQHEKAAQSHSMGLPQKPRIVSPVRRPILRSKSDLSHRYIKAGRSSTLTSGFTLVHVDLGPSSSNSPPPPVPIHNSISTNDFTSSPPPNSSSMQNKTYENFYHFNSHTHFHNHYGTLHYGTLQHYPNHHQNHNQNQHRNEQNQHQQNHHTHSYGQGGHTQSSSSGSHTYGSYSSSRELNKISSSQQSSGYSSGKSELDRFFDQLGLDNKFPSSSLTSLPASRPLSNISKDPGYIGSESPVFFSSVESIDSGARKSGSGDSEDSPPQTQAPSSSNPGHLLIGKIIGPKSTNLGVTGTGCGLGLGSGGPPGDGGLNMNSTSGPSIVVHHGEPSIVERNARVIKWLFNCRKAMDSFTASFKNSSSTNPSSNNSNR